MITLFLTRHAKSTRNYYDEKINPKNINDSIFRDCALCPQGIESIIKNRDALQSKIGQVDAIMTSPMKRCIQTTLATYESKNQKIHPIHVLPLLTEFGNRYDSTGRSMEEICTDPDIFEYKHFPALEFEQFFSEGLSHKVNSMNNLSWTYVNFLMDDSRITKFIRLLKENFIGKRIHAFTHHGFIKRLTGYEADNYQTICVMMDTQREVLSWKLVM
jgi:broad specificity phosphatase PhoE